VVEQLLDLSGIGRSRLQLRWVSAAEGQLFADYVTELSDLIGQLGPFQPDDFKLELAAVETVLQSTRIRWLMGVDRQITEQENVYHEKMDPEAYQAFVRQAVAEEYEKGLILQALADGPQSVREMAGKTGLPVYTVSLRLNDLERAGQAEFHKFEGTTAKFVLMAA
jgi:predicted Rossmann fold nucleotide-binding protein DprA/Smf involved in DNA uptake